MLLVGWLEAASRRASRSENDSAAGRAGLKPPPDAARRSCQWPRWRRCWSRDPGLPLRRPYWPRWLPCLPIAGSTWMPAKRGQDAPDGTAGVQGGDYSNGCCSAGLLKVASNGSQPFVVNGPLASVPVAMLLTTAPVPKMALQTAALVAMLLVNAMTAVTAVGHFPAWSTLQRGADVWEASQRGANV